MLFVTLHRDKNEAEMKRFAAKVALAVIVVAAASCVDKQNGQDAVPAVGAVSRSDVAGILASLPLQGEHLDEVFDAVNSSSGNGYDEEYMMADLFGSPGKGVGDPQTKAPQTYKTPLRDLFVEYLNKPTKASGVDAETFIDSVVESGMQIYWPYSEDWDGKTYPVITFDPGDGAESNYGYEISFDERGERVLTKVVVDEKMAMERPVWVINTNDDSTLTPLCKASEGGGTKAGEAAKRKLILKNFTMLRNYDSWFGGASEFLIKCGAVDGFRATKDEDLKLYTPTVTDFMIVVKRKQVGLQVPLDAVMLTDLTDQMEKIAFMIIEDDGGTSTSWKCEASVKYNSKSYGFDLNIPYKDRDDIVWRGQLDTSYFEKVGPTTGRFGDVKVTFMIR